MCLTRTDESTKLYQELPQDGEIQVWKVLKNRDGRWGGPHISSYTYQAGLNKIEPVDEWAVAHFKRLANPDATNYAGENNLSVPETGGLGIFFDNNIFIYSDELIIPCYIKKQDIIHCGKWGAQMAAHVTQLWIEHKDFPV